MPAAPRFLNPGQARLEAAAVAVVALRMQAPLKLGDLETELAELAAPDPVPLAAAQLEADLADVAAQAERLAARQGAPLHRTLDPGIDPVEIAAQLEHGLPAPAIVEAATALIVEPAVALTAVATVMLLGATLPIALRHGGSGGEGGRNDRERD